ncbi:EAL domain-containing protein [Sulfurimonas sp.]
MLLPAIKEREYRFTLALRIGLPIFALVLALVSHTLITNYSSLETSFYVESLLLLMISIYFIFYLLYKGFDVKIRDYSSGTFTREYLQNYLSKDLKLHKEYTLILIRIENLDNINQVYGIKYGDKALKETVKWIVKYLKKEKIENFPIGHFQGGDFILGLKKNKEKYTTILELLSLKAREFKVDDVEIKISTAITDTHYSHELDFLIEDLFHLQENTKKIISSKKEENIDPNQLEIMVIQAIKNKNLIINFQDVFENKKVVMRECFIKLKNDDGKIIYPKTYIKIVQKLGLRLTFDLMVLEESIKMLKDETTALALNISTASLRNDRVLRKTEEILKNVKARKIVFILSEQEYYSFTSRYNTIINSLKSMGALICIDKVGSYHSSFLYLRELDIDMIRYDTYYSNEMKLRNNKSIVDGFNLMAKEKKIKTWIKNLQDEESVTLAENANIDYIQGKYLAELKEIKE